MAPFTTTSELTAFQRDFLSEKCWKNCGLWAECVAQWGEHLPSKHKGRGLVLSSGGKKKMKRKRKLSFLRFLVLE